MFQTECYPQLETPAQTARAVPYYVQLLQTELCRRKESKNGYSLRAFASHLGLDPSALSKVLKGVKHLSVRSSLNIVKRVGFTETEKRQFLMSVAEEKSQNICNMLDVELQTPLQPPLSLSNLRQFLSKSEPQIDISVEKLNPSEHPLIASTAHSATASAHT